MGDNAMRFASGLAQGYSTAAAAKAERERQEKNDKLQAEYIQAQIKESQLKREQFEAQQKESAGYFGGGLGATPPALATNEMVPGIRGGNEIPADNLAQFGGNTGTPEPGQATIPMSNLSMVGGNTGVPAPAIAGPQYESDLALALKGDHDAANRIIVMAERSGKPIDEVLKFLQSQENQATSNSYRERMATAAEGGLVERQRANRRADWAAMFNAAGTLAERQAAYAKMASDTVVMDEMAPDGTRYTQRVPVFDEAALAPFAAQVTSMAQMYGQNFGQSQNPPQHTRPSLDLTRPRVAGLSAISTPIPEKDLGEWRDSEGNKPPLGITPKQAEEAGYTYGIIPAQERHLWYSPEYGFNVTPDFGTTKEEAKKDFIPITQAQYDGLKDTDNIVGMLDRYAELAKIAYPQSSGRVGGAISRGAASVTQSGGVADALAEMNTIKSYMFGPLSRSVALEVGVLTNQDIERIKSSMLEFADSGGRASVKIKSLQDLLRMRMKKFIPIPVSQKKTTSGPAMRDGSPAIPTGTTAKPQTTSKAKAAPKVDSGKRFQYIDRVMQAKGWPEDKAMRYVDALIEKGELK